MAAPDNVVGYGPDNRFQPPLFNPDWMLSIMERHILLTFTFPLITIGGTTTSIINGLTNGDAYDGYYYNSAGAAGTQIYPYGLSKYYDLYSLNGIFNYIAAYIWISATNLLSPLTLLPIDIWQAMFNGYEWDNWWYIFMPWPWLDIFGMRGEAGWYLW